MHLVADLENLCLDPMPAIDYCMRTALREMGHTPDPQMRLDWVVNVPFVDAAMLLLEDESADRLDEFTTRYQRLFACRGRKAFGFYPGARDAINALQRQPNRHVHYLTHIGPKPAQALLEHYAFVQVVDSIFTAPAPQCRMCRASLLENLSFQLRKHSDEDIVFATDDPAELAMAKHMGITTIGLEYGRTPVNILKRAEPDVLIADAQSLPSALALLDATPSVAGAH